MAKIWIVFGSTGEYSDRSEWPVAAFDTEKAAVDLVEACEVWCQARGFSMNRNDRSQVSTRHDDYDQRGKAKHPHDPGFHCDYTGTDYYSIDVEFRKSSAR